VSTQTPEHDDTWVVAPPALQGKPPVRRLHPGVVVAIVAGSLLVIVGALYGIAYAMAGDNVPKNAVVSGVPVGGLTPEEAVPSWPTSWVPQRRSPSRSRRARTSLR